MRDFYELILFQRNNRRSKRFTGKIQISKISDPTISPKTKEAKLLRASRRIKTLSKSRITNNTPPRQKLIPYGLVPILFSSPPSYQKYLTRYEDNGLDPLDSDLLMLSSQSSESDEDFTELMEPDIKASDAVSTWSKLFCNEIFNKHHENVDLGLTEISQYLVFVKEFINNHMETNKWPFIDEYPELINPIVFAFQFPPSPTWDLILELLSHLCKVYHRKTNRHALWYKISVFTFKFHGLSQMGLKTLRKFAPFPSTSTHLRFKKYLVKKMDQTMQNLPSSNLLVLHFDNHQLNSLHHSLKVSEKQSNFIVMLAGACASVPAELFDEFDDEIVELPQLRAITLDIFDVPLFIKDIFESLEKQSTHYKSIFSSFPLVSKLSQSTELPNSIPNDFLNNFSNVKALYDSNKVDPSLSFYTQNTVFGSPTKSTSQEMVSAALDWKYDLTAQSQMFLDMRPEKNPALESWKSFSLSLYNIIIKKMIQSCRSPRTCLARSGLTKNVFIQRAQSDNNWLVQLVQKKVKLKTQKCSFGGIICGVDQKIYQWIVSSVSQNEDFRQFPILGEMHLSYNISHQLLKLFIKLPIGKFLMNGIDAKLSQNGTVLPFSDPFMERTIQFFIILGYSIRLIDDICTNSAAAKTSLERKLSAFTKSRSWDFCFFMSEVAVTLNLLQISFKLINIDVYMECIRRLCIFSHAFPGTTLSEYRPSTIDYFVSMMRLPRKWREKILRFASSDPMYNQIGLNSTRRQYLDWANEFLNLSMNFVSSGAVSEESIRKQNSFSNICSVLRPHIYDALNMEKEFSTPKENTSKSMVEIARVLTSFIKTYTKSSIYTGENLIYPYEVQKRRTQMTLYSRQMGIYGRITDNLNLVLDP